MLLRVGAVATVEKLEWATGRIKSSWSGVVVGRSRDRVVLHGAFQSPTGRPLEIDGVRIGPEDLFTEYYFLRRWYVVLAITGPAGDLKGWYCDVAQPARIEGQRIRYVDLYLDLFVHADGRCTILDAEEFEAHVIGSGAVREARQARGALRALIRQAQRAGLPGNEELRLKSEE